MTFSTGAEFNIIFISLQFNVSIELKFACIPQHHFSILAMWQHKRLVMIFQINKHKNSSNGYNVLLFYFYFIFLFSTDHDLSLDWLISQTGTWLSNIPVPGSVSVTCETLMCISSDLIALYGILCLYHDSPKTCLQSIIVCMWNKLWFYSDSTIPSL